MNIYAIRDDAGYVKFGITEGNPIGRMRDMQTGNAQRLELVGYGEHEKAARLEDHLHKALKVAGLHARGEWFEPAIGTTCVANAISVNYLDEAMMIAITLGAIACSSNGGFTDDQIAGSWWNSLPERICPCCIGKIWRDGMPPIGCEDDE